MTQFFLLTAKARKKNMKKILSNVDSEKSTLLHLAVESGNSEVKTKITNGSRQF